MQIDVNLPGSEASTLRGDSASLLARHAGTDACLDAWGAEGDDDLPCYVEPFHTSVLSRVERRRCLKFEPM